MPKPNPKHKSKPCQLGWTPSVKGNYSAIKTAFKNEMLLNKQVNFLLSVLKAKELIELVTVTEKDDDGNDVEHQEWKCI